MILLFALASLLAGELNLHLTFGQAVPRGEADAVQPAPFFQLFERNADRLADRLAERHRLSAERAAGRGDWREFAIHLRLRALHDLASARRGLPPALTRARPPLPAFDAIGPGRDAAGPTGLFDPLFAAVPALREKARRSPTLRGALVALHRPPPGVEGFRVSRRRPPAGVRALHFPRGDEVVLEFAADLSSPHGADSWAPFAVLFELCNARGTPARRELAAGVTRREVTRRQFVDASVRLERVAWAETCLIGAAVIEADGPPRSRDVSAWLDRIALSPPSAEEKSAWTIRTDGYPWAWFGRNYEVTWVQAWSENWEGKPMWPVWVAAHRAPEYAISNLPGRGGFVAYCTPFIKRQAKRRLLYVLLDALPGPWARRLYMTPGVEWLDAPGLYVEAVAAERR